MIEIGSFLRDKECQIFPSDLWIHIEANSLFTYPGLSIFCDDVDQYKKRTDTALNPTVITEVLSKGTQYYDKGTKFNLYQQIPSLKDYIMISPLEVLVEKYLRQAENEWLYTTYKADDRFMINSIGLLVTVGSLYRNVKFEGRYEP